MKKEKFDIQGMTCSSCSAHVERAVSKLEGIKSVNVNLLSNNMIVEYDENIANNEKIIKAVIDTGYGARISGTEKNTQSKKRKSTKQSRCNKINEKKANNISMFFNTTNVYSNVSYVL